MPTLASIGLGSNLGDRRLILESALRAIAETPGVRLVASSSLHETAPVGGPSGQGPFLNAAALVETNLDPATLHARLRAIETEAGRIRRVRWGERTLDLDLLILGNHVIDTPDLVVPHPRFAVRRFVVAPLAEVAPNLVDPLTGHTISALLANLDRRPSTLAILADSPTDLHKVAEVVHLVASSLPGAILDSPSAGRSADDLCWRITQSISPKDPTFVARIGTTRATRTNPTTRPPTLFFAPDSDAPSIAADILAACEATRTG